MSKVEDINNHMAWTCDCGCCRFNLIRSGKIECDECGKIQDAEHTLNKAEKNPAHCNNFKQGDKE